MGDSDIWGDFGDGLAPGRKNGKFGFYDFDGNWVIKPMLIMHVNSKTDTQQ